MIYKYLRLQARVYELENKFYKMEKELNNKISELEGFIASVDQSDCVAHGRIDSIEKEFRYDR